MAHRCFSCAMGSRAGAPLRSGHCLVHGRGAVLEDSCCAGLPALRCLPACPSLACPACACCLPAHAIVCPARACCLPALAAPDEEEEEEKKPKTKKVTETITEWKALNDNQVCARKGISTSDQVFKRTGNSEVQSG